MIAVIALVLVVALMIQSHHSSTVDYKEFKVEEVTCTKSNVSFDHSNARNLVAVFTGRWQFLRILFPYLIRELRQNGGVVDEIEFIIVQCEERTLEKLSKLVDMTNSLAGNEILKITNIPHEPARTYDDAERGLLRAISFYFLDKLTDPELNIFKIDDDIIYIHPKTFEIMVRESDYDRCNIHFANIAGSNWRCSFIHQEMGVYDNPELNPDRLEYEFNPFAECGWSSKECAKLGLHAFLHHYHKKSLGTYTMPGLHIMEKRDRFSINFYMLSQKVITKNMAAFSEASPITNDDEEWWSEKFGNKAKQPNCVVGGGLVLHFSYFKTVDYLLGLDILKEFEKIVYLEVGTLLTKQIWETLEFVLK